MLRVIWGCQMFTERGAAFERQMRVVFDVLDELQVSATFFLLGSTMACYPDIIRELAQRGDEIACHGYHHHRVYMQTEDDFRRDIEQALELTERLTGQRPVGYRAPEFSINRESIWAYEALADLGFQYDSSLNHSPRIPRRLRFIPSKPFRMRLPSGRELFELPIAVFRRSGLHLPVGGGSYFRLLPYPLVAHALAQCTTARDGAPVYFHPYEVDPMPLKAPGGEATGAGGHLRAGLYNLWYNLRRASIRTRFQRLAQEFRFVPYREAIQQMTNETVGAACTLTTDGTFVAVKGQEPA